MRGLFKGIKVSLKSPRKVVSSFYLRLKIFLRNSYTILSFLICAIAGAVFLVACGHPQIVTKEVFIPQKCDIDMPAKPSYTKGDFAKNLEKYVRYSKQLENALSACIQK